MVPFLNACADLPTQFAFEDGELINAIGFNSFNALKGSKGTAC